MTLHRLLQRQLAKFNLSKDCLPEKTDNWHEFIRHVSKAYEEHDQDRYLLERSIDISSKEMRESNAMLEYAQEIARMGYWHYEANTDTSTWSKGLFLILGLSPNQAALNYEDFMKLVHPEDEADFRKQVDMALEYGMPYEYDLRIQKANEGYRWYRTIARTDSEKKQLSGVMMDINDIKLSEELRKELHAKLVTTARMAGMSEVATSILHNVGNILNSVNVSAAILKKNISKDHHKKLAAILAMVETHLVGLEQYLTEDSKGKLILPYLAALANALTTDFESNIAEAESLETNISHIKDIISTQQSLGGKTTVIETISLPDLINNAIKSISLEKYHVRVKVVFDTDTQIITSDKSKLFQILTNLLANAKDAMYNERDLNRRNITVQVSESDNSMLCIRVYDQGIGISQSDLERIFSFGFTTKQHGHGFGLHSCAIYARELGGSLVAESAGKNKGACFILTLPIFSKDGE